MFKDLYNLRFLSVGMLFAFCISIIYPAASYAQELSLPVPGKRIALSPASNPPILKGLKVHPDNPFSFDFILDQGDKDSFEAERDIISAKKNYLNSESTKLIKYFLSSLTTPEQDLWVNLSPYEKNRIVPEKFGQTEMGRDLLAQDYILKQITASLIYPDGEVGKKFWKRVYEESAKQFGTTNIPINTFNKVWIIPEKAVVYENTKAGTAYVVESKLKVMLEEDYLAIDKNVCRGGPCVRPQTTNAIGSQITREIVIPELTKEINSGKNFAQLRQVYNSLILATWYKKKIKDSILNQVYSNKNKVSGLNAYRLSLNAKEIYQRYLQSFKKGVFNYIKDSELPSGVSTPRKYFSGGLFMGDRAMNAALVYQQMLPTVNIDHAEVVQVKLMEAQDTEGLSKDQAMLDDSGEILEKQLSRSPEEMILDSSFADHMVEGIRALKNLGSYSSFREITLGSHGFKLGVTNDNRMYRIGPLLFPTMTHLNRFDWQLWDQVYGDFVNAEVKSYDIFYTKRRHNIFFIPPRSVTDINNTSAGAIDAHTAIAIAAMLDNAKMFKGATVIDIGSGFGLLSMIALSLGAKKVHLLENIPFFNEIARAGLEAASWTSQEKFSLYNADMSSYRVTDQMLHAIGQETQNVIVLNNIGMTYGDLNDKALRFANRFKDLRLVINAGHYAGNPNNLNGKAGKNQETMESAEAIFRERNLNYQRFDYFPNGENKEGVAVYVAKSNHDAAMRAPVNFFAVRRQLSLARQKFYSDKGSGEYFAKAIGLLEKVTDATGYDVRDYLRRIPVLPEQYVWNQLLKQLDQMEGKFEPWIGLNNDEILEIEHIVDLLDNSRSNLSKRGKNLFTRLLGKGFVKNLVEITAEELPRNAVVFASDANINDHINAKVISVDEARNRSAGKNTAILLAVVPKNHPTFFLSIKYSDAAMTSVKGNLAQVTRNEGGIDFKGDRVHVEAVKDGNGEGVQFHMDPAMRARFQKSSGFVPVIVGHFPLNNLREFLEVR